MNEPKLRGFAAMTLEARTAIASRGGKRAHELGRAHKYTSDEARAAGRKGGIAVSHDRAHMSRIGRKGGSVKRVEK